jgi:hypothetical protein
VILLTELFLHLAATAHPFAGFAAPRRGVYRWFVSIIGGGAVPVLAGRLFL